MFTGIIETIGQIQTISTSGGIRCLKIDTKIWGLDLELGESIAVQGTCVTVTSIKDTVFSADISDETIRRTTLSHLAIGTYVNLERAVTPITRMGGHFVLGHVDVVGKVTNRVEKPAGLDFQISVLPGWRKYLAEKGSVSIDGVSLTVTGVNSEGFSTVIIPFSLESTTLKNLKIGDSVNLEFDILAKYMERLINQDDGKPKGMSEEFLKQYGFA